MHNRHVSCCRAAISLANAKCVVCGVDETAACQACGVRRCATCPDADHAAECWVWCNAAAEFRDPAVHRNIGLLALWCHTALGPGIMCIAHDAGHDYSWISHSHPQLDPLPYESAVDTEHGTSFCFELVHCDAALGVTRTARRNSILMDMHCGAELLDAILGCGTHCMSISESPAHVYTIDWSDCGAAPCA